MQHALAVLSEHDLAGFAGVRIEKFQNTVPPVPCRWVIERGHLPRKGLRRRQPPGLRGLCCGSILPADAPAGVRHLLKYRAREQRLAQGAGRFRQDRAARKLRARLFDQLKIRIRALAQRRDAEQLALSAVDGRIAILAAKPGNLRVHRVIIALGGIEAAGRDHDLPLAGAVVPARVAAGVHVGHKRQRHRQLPVDEQLELAGNAEIIERKAPDQHVGGKNFPDHTGHIVLQYALARRFAPAGEAAAARQQMQLSDLDGFSLHRLRLPQAVQKRACEPVCIAFVPLGTSVQNQNSHTISSSRLMQSSAQAMHICA